MCKKVPLMLKGKLYRTVIKPAMLYGMECWLVKKTQERKMEIAEMRMLRWSCGRSLTHRIPNSVFSRTESGVASILSKLFRGWISKVWPYAKKTIDKVSWESEPCHSTQPKRKGSPETKR